jgi:WD40 repeat protein
MGVTALALSADGRRAISGSLDRTVRLWGVDTGEELYRFTGHTDVVGGVALSPDGRLALSGGADATVRLWGLPEDSGAAGEPT